MWIIIFILGLGNTGLVDETPPLFAAAARGMSESGDWITPRSMACSVLISLH